ncbi:MAG: AlpA family phage regulatory protein [Deltaproteobacteria bacterium]|nr:AlpA family phage regulatory protein [Deltaproteobacteria bacterium]
MPKLLLERREVEELTGLSCASIYRLMRLKRFPEPLKISERAVRWKAAEIEAWIESRPRATGEAAA